MTPCAGPPKPSLGCSALLLAGGGGPVNEVVRRPFRAMSLYSWRSCGGDTRTEAGVSGLGGSWAWGGAHIALRGHRMQQRGARACKGKGEAEGRRAYLRPPGHIARWRSASKHLVEDGVEGGGGFRATLACHNIKRINADGPSCGAVVIIYASHLTATHSSHLRNAARHVHESMRAPRQPG